ncbi:hypothetical protein GCM10011335_05150 [Aureimonas glaciei]|uniref:Uncharacterized protein n=1 Tax=Aureimonas glaciei TaxID=1776957 RepID=A0A916XSU7_9HYPH|nr:hypothetical protein GCM10011335_05150 [Aureimonas glaciei]
MRKRIIDLPSFFRQAFCRIPSQQSRRGTGKKAAVTLPVGPSCGAAQSRAPQRRASRHRRFRRRGPDRTAPDSGFPGA